MPKKFLTLAIFFLLLVSVYVESTSFSGRAFAAPLTNPATSPVTFFNLSGKVVYRQLGRLLNNAKRVVPAEGVVVKIFSFFGGNQVGTATTDSTGMYQLELPTGMYRVEASDTKGTFFTPPLRVINVKKGQSKTGDFQGLLFTSF